MPKQPLTTAGVQAKQAELNQLSNADLLVQANQIRSNLTTWVNNNFTLDNTQSAFLTGIDARWIQYTSGVLGFAVENRLPVTWTVKGKGSGKLIKTLPGPECDYSNVTGFKALGSLAFEVDYS